LYSSFNDTPVLTRFEYIKQLGRELIVPHLRKRVAATINLPRDLKSSIQNVLDEGNPQQQHKKETQPQGGQQLDIPSDRIGKRKTCATCPYQKKRKTTYMCISCNNAICLECSRKLCLECSQKISA